MSDLETTEDLQKEYDTFLEDTGLPSMSADELAWEDEPTEEQKAWLREFVDKWHAAENRAFEIYLQNKNDV